jgi:hypothetical protein
MTQIITPEQRLAEPRGARILLVGPNGVGKTTQAGKLDPDQTLIVDTDNGTLAIADVPASHIRPETWPEIRDLVIRIAGPNRSFAPQEPYSQSHFERMGGFLPDIERYQTIFFDTVTAAARLCFRWAAQQPEAFSERGNLDLRSTYGLHAREFLLALHHLQSTRKHIVLTGVLETVVDEYGRVEHKLQAEGQRVPREILGIVDIVVTMHWISWDDKPTRAFVCTSPNPWAYPAKDRSGKLDQIEPPDLNKLIAKILPLQANHVVAVGGAVGQS